MSIFARIFLFLGDRFKDLSSVTLSTLGYKRKLQLLHAYTKILFLQYTVGKVRAVERVSVLGFKIETPDWYSFFYIFREIFIHGIYHIPKKEQPRRVVDCGANIGMAILFYKWLWPDVIVHAYEPDPDTFKTLQKNVEGNALSGVTLHNVAVSASSGTLNFFSNPAQIGSGRNTTVKERGHKDFVSRKVESVDAATLLSEGAIDVLKMDIEGAEYEVLRRLVDSGGIKLVKHYIVEYHHNILGQKHTFADFLKLLDTCGMTYRIHSTDALNVENDNFYQDVMVHAYSGEVMQAHRSKES